MSFTRIVKRLGARAFYSVHSAHEFEHHLETMSNALATHSNAGSIAMSQTSSNHIVEEITHHGRFFSRSKHHSESFATASAPSHEMSASDHTPVSKFEAW